ncbi:MAG: flippase [Candidatus Liptonbacteria bacterium]|nr:flippase [Candidatus Liptonbacteria bacterium]
MNSQNEKESSFGVEVKNFLFKNLTNRQTLAKNAFWLAVGNLGGRFIRAAVIIYAARVLGAAGWGVFSYGITLVAFLTIFVDIGIDSILTRESAKAKEDLLRQVQIISTSFFIKILLLAMGVLVVIFVAPEFATLPGVDRLLPIMAAILVFDTFRNLGFSLIRAREKMEVEAALYLLTNVAIVAFGFGALYLRPTVMSFTLAYAVGTAIGLLATSYVLRKDIAGTLSNFSKSLVKEILSSAWPFAISGVLGLLLLNTDILIIGWFRSATDVGFYSASVRVIQLLYIFGGVLASSSLPIFSRFIKEEQERIRIALRNILRFAFSFSLPVAFCGIAAGNEIINLLFGAEYAPAALSFQLLLMTFTFGSMAVILNNVIFVYNRQRVLIVYAAIGGFLNVAFDLLLIPRYGINGSAVATLLSSIIADFYLWYIAWRIVGFDLNLKVGKILLSSAVSALFLYAILRMGAHILLAIPLAGLLYLTMLYLLKESILKEARSILQAG